MKKKDRRYSELDYYTYQELLLDVILLGAGVAELVVWWLPLVLLIILRFIYSGIRLKWKMMLKNNTILTNKEIRSLRSACQRYLPGCNIDIKPYGALITTDSLSIGGIGSVKKRFPEYRFERKGNTIQISMVRKKKEAELFQRYSSYFNLDSSWYGERLKYRRMVCEVMGLDLDSGAVLLRNIHNGKIIELL